MSEHDDIDGGTSLGRSALTPLLDVLFLLLFAVLATSERASSPSTEESDGRAELDVRLPDVPEDEATAPSPDERERVELVIDANGDVRVRRDGDETLVRDGGALVTAIGADDVVVEVRADADARHAVVLEVLHALWSAGIEDVRYVAAVSHEGDGPRVFGGGER